MKLRCKKEAIAEDGTKVMQFTKGKLYDFRTHFDPRGFSTEDDNGMGIVFFDVNEMFEPL